MKNYLSGLVLICIVILTFAREMKVNAQNADPKKARELWEQVIAAKGGRENLYAVENLVVSVKTKYKKLKRGFTGNHTESLYVLPDKWWFWVDEPPFGLGIWTYNFSSKVGWEVDEGFPSQTIKPSADVSTTSKIDVRFRFVNRKFSEDQLIYLMETKWLQPTIIGVRAEKLNSQKVDVIEISYGNQKFEYYIDKQTHLPKQVVIRTLIEKTGTSVDGKEHTESFMLSDYVEVSGIKFPRVVRRGNESTETTYQVNVDYNKNIFENPSTLDMGSEAWKLSK